MLQSFESSMNTKTLFFQAARFLHLFFLIICAVLELVVLSPLLFQLASDHIGLGLKLAPTLEGRQGLSQTDDKLVCGGLFLLGEHPQLPLGDVLLALQNLVAHGLLQAAFPFRASLL